MRGRVNDGTEQPGLVQSGVNEPVVSVNRLLGSLESQSY